MTNKQIFVGSIPIIASNQNSLYEGNLKSYFKVIFSAPNIHNGYHGLRHMLHVTWACYEACKYYDKEGSNLLCPRQMRSLLIAALFHDYGHCGKSGDDEINIEVAIRGLFENIQPEDELHKEKIASVIRATKFPHEDLGENITLEQKILRDADASQTFSTAWIGEVLAGLGSEFDESPLEMLKIQDGFLKSLSFYSDFGKEFWGNEAIKAKIEETQELISILES